MDDKKTTRFTGMSGILVLLSEIEDSWMDGCSLKRHTMIEFVPRGSACEMMELKLIIELLEEKHGKVLY